MRKKKKLYRNKQRDELSINTNGTRGGIFKACISHAAIWWPTPHKDPVINTGSKPCWARRITPSVGLGCADDHSAWGKLYRKIFLWDPASRPLTSAGALGSLESRRVSNTRGWRWEYGFTGDGHALGRHRRYYPSSYYVRERALRSLQHRPRAPQLPVFILLSIMRQGHGWRT